MSGVNIITNNGRVSGGGELVTIKVLHQAAAALLISLKGFLSPFSLWLHPRPGQCWAVRGILATNTSARTPRNIGRTLHTYLHFPHHHHLHMHINYCRFRLYYLWKWQKIINIRLPLSNYTTLSLWRTNAWIMNIKLGHYWEESMNVPFLLINCLSCLIFVSNV